MNMFDMLLNRLKNQNPQGYKAFMAIRNSGRNPTDVLGEMYRKGELSDAQLNQVCAQLSRFGKKVPKSEIDKIKAGGRQEAPQPSVGASKFKGIF